MQGLMIYENPVIRLGFTAVMKKEFDIDIDYTDRDAVLRAANALIPYESVDALRSGFADGLMGSLFTLVGCYGKRYRSVN